MEEKREFTKENMLSLILRIHDVYVVTFVNLVSRY